MAVNKMSLNNLVTFKKGESGNPNGRPKGSRNKKTILRELLSIKVDDTNQCLENIKELLPELFKDKKDFTIEELIFARLIREAIFSESPILYMKELFDRFYGKTALEGAEDAEDAQGAEWERRMIILSEQIALAENEQED
jgi:hypothetical protein